MQYRHAQHLLEQTFEEVKHQHQERGHRFIRTHWWRYVHLISRFPALSSQSTVLEVGASILSSLIRRRFRADVHTVYHELEPEWPARYAPDGIHCYPVELTRDPLPVEDNHFDLILCDEVAEHLPVAPPFFVKQLMAKLKPEGMLMFSVPNFATSEKRLQLLTGTNPQDPMDERFVYYSHHREPVMKECTDLLAQCGGVVISREWADCRCPPSLPKVLWRCALHLRHGDIHPFIHQFLPSTRFYLMLQARRKAGYFPRPEEMTPPLSTTREFREPLLPRSSTSAA